MTPSPASGSAVFGLSSSYAYFPPSHSVQKCIAQYAARDDFLRFFCCRTVWSACRLLIIIMPGLLQPVHGEKDGSTGAGGPIGFSYC